MHRETGRQGIDRPLTSSAANGSPGNLASLAGYKVCALLRFDAGTVLSISLASCPAPPDSLHESGRTESGRGEPLFRSPLTSTHSAYYGSLLDNLNTASSQCRDTPFNVPAVLFQRQQDHHSCHTFRGLLRSRKQFNLSFQGSATLTLHSSS